MNTGENMRITKPERRLIQNTFQGQEDLLRLMRKVFLPELDPSLPLGQNMDLWMTVKLEGLSLEEQLINLKARNALISHIDNCLITLKTLAESPEETPEQAVDRIKKDSAK